MQHILSNYTGYGRPVKDPSEPLNLTASLRLTQFIRMVSNKTACHKTLMAYNSTVVCKRKLLNFQRHRQLKNGSEYSLKCYLKLSFLMIRSPNFSSVLAMIHINRQNTNNAKFGHLEYIDTIHVHCCLSLIVNIILHLFISRMKLSRL